MKRELLITAARRVLCGRIQGGYAAREIGIDLSLHRR